MREKTIETFEKTILTCDKCGWKSTDLKDGKWKRPFYTCSICAGDFCEKCGDRTDNDYERGNYDGDYYSYWICDSCWEMGKPFLEQDKKDSEELERIAEAYWKDKENWVKKWMKKVKNG